MIKENMIPSGELLSYLIKHDRFAYVQADATLRITAVSPNLTQLFQLPQLLLGEHVTVPFRELVGAENVLEAILQGEQDEYRLEEVSRIQPSGTALYFNLHIVGSDNGTGLLVIVENISGEGVLKQALVQERNELRLAKTQLTEINDRLRQLDQFKNMFLSMAAHDLRTPLFVISGYLQMMLMETVSNDHRDLLENALLQIQWLDYLVLDFLSLDKIERGEMRIVPVAFDLARVVNNVKELFTSVVISRQQTLLLELPEGKTAVWGEEGRVRQIFFNLLSNATKYSLTNSIIRVSVWLEGNQVVLRVSDTGPGLTPEEQELIFVPYYRTGSARQENVSGTGLGLFITKMLVEAHNGTIAVHSEIDKGTTFTIYLPRPPAE